MRNFSLLFLLVMLTVPRGYGQTVNTSALGTSTLSLPVKSYKEATAYSQNLYNGRIYYWYDYRSEEHQFYKDADWNIGQLHYDGQQHDSIPMKYDVHRNQLVIRHLNGDHMLLQSPKIKWFVINQHRFQYMTSGVELPASMRSSFYDQVYTGKTAFIVDRKKDRQEKIVDKSVVSFYPVKDTYYLQRDGMYKQVRSKKSVLSLFPGKEKSLKRALRGAHIPYRKEREAAILLMVQHYDQTTL